MEHLLAVTLVAAATTVTGPTGVELERLIDSTVSLPGTSGPILFDGIAPVPCGQGVLFRAIDGGASMSWAYSVTSSGVEVVVDEETMVPGSAEVFQDLAEFHCLGGERYIFPGQGEGAPGSAFEWHPGSPISLVQSGGVSVGGYDFGALVEASASEYGAGILGRLVPGNFNEALMSKPFAGPPIFVAAEGDTTLPGQNQPADNLNSPAMMGPDLLFRARTAPTPGFFLYRWSETSGFSVVVDGQTAVPGVATTFTGVGQFTALSGGIAFAGGYNGGGGIYLSDSEGDIQPLVLPGQTTVDGDTIAFAFDPTGAASLVAFRGWTEEMGQFRPSIFVRSSDGQIRRILGLGDVIEGHTVLFVDGRADDRSVAVRIDYAEGLVPQSVIYRANLGGVAGIPGLSRSGAVALIVAVLAVGLWILARRDRKAAPPRGRC